VAPIGAFGAMAFTIGKYGVVTLLSLGKLMAAFYLTCLIFIFVVLGGLPGSAGSASASSSATSRRSC
jgi:aerobic C4-dicarboxylate transport protein